MTGLLPTGTAPAVGRVLTPEPERELPEDPVTFVQERLNEHVWSKSREIMRAVGEHRHVAVPAAHDVSKSWTVSRLAAWWIEGHPPGEAFVVSAAPTENQVKAIIWREIGRAHRRGNLQGRVTLDARWFVGPAGEEELVAFGRKPQDLADAGQAMQAFQGIHARYVLVILDEATGIPGWLWDAAESLATNEGSRIIAIGNPDDPTSRFAKVCAPGSGWHVIRISAYDSPNFTNEWVPEYLRELLVSRTWVEERRQRWGEESALFQSKVKAEFPDTSDVHVISPAQVKAAQLRELLPEGRGAYGLDVARFGSDTTQLYRAQGGVVRLVAEWRKADTVETTNNTLGHVQSEVPIVVDADGIGGGVYDQLRRAEVGGLPAWVLAFTAQDKVRQPRRFANRRSEIWWTMREVFEDGAIDLDPDDDDLAAQLQAPKWGYDGRGRIKVETKEEMAKRGVPSPDKADAAIIAMLGGPPEGMRAPGQYTAHTNGGAKRMETAGLRDRPL